MTVLALVRPEMRAAIDRQLALIGTEVMFVDKAADLPAITHAGRVFSVAILPASFPEADTWAFWGELRLLNPRPEILIYANRVNFQVWSGVLEAGCRDVLIEPFSGEELCRAVLDAGKAFEERRSLDVSDEVS